MAQILLPAELHVPICETLAACNRVLQNRLDDEVSVGFRYVLREHTYKYLASFAPEAIPHFWEMLKDETTSKEFWPVLGRIRDRNAVPYLLELLPQADYPVEHRYWNIGVAPVLAPERQGLEYEGQLQVLEALREIADVRAVPVLQAMEQRQDHGKYHVFSGNEFLETQRENNQLAEQAGKAARHILRNSKDAGALLLRPSEARPADGKTLLRPARPAADTTPANELLRPSDET